MQKVTTLFIALIVHICSYGQGNYGGNYTFEIECLESELDGSITVKSWGNGKNFADAKDQAQKNAVNAVLFKGISDGKPGCPLSPLISDPRVREQKKEYFANFFRDDKGYAQYVSTKDEQKKGRRKKNKKEAIESVTHGFVMRIDVLGLEKKLKADGIIQ